MGRNTRRNYVVHEEVYHILKEKPKGLTAQQINDILNSRDKNVNNDSIYQKRVRGLAKGNSTIQLSSILSGGILFESHDSTTKRDSLGRMTPVKVYKARDLEDAYQRMLNTNKPVSKFPKVLQNYAKSKVVEQ